MYAKKREFQIPAWLFFTLSLLLDEFVFQLWTGAALPLTRIITMALFTLSFALLLSLLSTIGGALAGRIVAIALSALFAALYFAEYLMHDAYGGEGGYMSLGIIFGTAAAAGNDFGGTIVSVVFDQLWRLLLLLLPAALYGVLGGLRHWGKCGGWLTRGVIAAACLACFGLGVLSVRVFPDAEKYDKKFDFCEGVNTFGLLTALRLDLMNGDRTLEFSPPPTAPSVSAAPTDPPETEPTEAATETDAAPEETEPDWRMHPENPRHDMGLDLAALAQSETNPEIAKLHSYAASLPAASTNDCTGLFAGKNLIFVCAESFAAELIDPALTPTLYRLATKGIQFRDYYQPAWGGSTSTGEFSNLTGLVPTNASAMTNSIGKNLYFTLGNRLQAAGYATYGFHNNSYDYYHRDRTHQNLGMALWMGMGNGMEQGVAQTWPESDREMIDYTMDLYLDRQPFYVYYMTVSGHGLYSRGGNFLSDKNYDAVAGMDAAETVKCYYAANLELEYAMADLVERLERDGLLDDTVIVLATDHYPYCLEQSATWHTERDYLQDLYGFPVTNGFERDHSALILWSGCLETMGLELTVDTPTYSLDIVPTLLNLFGIEFDSRLLVGRDVFSDAEPLALWSNHSWKTDRGSYDASTGVFTPADGAEVDGNYVERISAAVSNKINYSRGVLQWDYFNVLFGP